jgi:hypothetical protein
MREMNFLAACGLGVALVFTGTSAQADVDKCQAALEKEMEKLHKDAFQRLDKCLDFIAKEKVKREKRIADGKGDQPNWDFFKAARLCETQLSKTYGASANGADGAIKKYDDKINGLFPSKCTKDDLIKIGHQVVGGSEGSAPGSQVQDFVREFLKVAAIKRAIINSWTVNQDARDLLQAGIEGFPSGNYGKASDSGGPVKCTGDHPNLCQFHRSTPSADNSFSVGTGSLNIHCRVHECELDSTDVINDVSSSSKATVELAGGADIPVTLNGSLAFEFCKLEEVQWVPALFRDYMFVIGEPNRILVRTFLDNETAICIDGWGAEGWCGCTDSGPPISHDFCIDHNTDPTDECSAVETPAVEECFCVDPTGPNPCGGVQQDDCVLLRDSNGDTIPCTATNSECVAENPLSRCNSSVLGEPCHPSLVTSTQLSFTGTSGVGDCAIFNIQTITIVDQDKYGPDGIPCTEDDAQPTNSQSTTVFTTGITNSVLFSAIAAPGECVGSSPNFGAKCARDDDCGPAPNGLCFGPNILTQFNNTATGGLKLPGQACETMETSNLQGLQLVSSFPFADGLGLGDGTATNEFVCR